MTDTPQDDPPQSELPQEGGSIEMDVPRRYGPTPFLLKSANSPPHCMCLNTAINVTIYSSTAKGNVAGNVLFADPKTRLCQVEYTVEGRSMWKWVSIDETTPKLRFPKWATELSPEVEDRVAEVKAGGRDAVTSVIVPRTVTALAEASEYKNEHCPRITSVRELLFPVTVTVFSKTQQSDVDATVSRVSADGQYCCVVYGGNYKWVPVGNVKPPLIVNIESKE